MQLLPSDPDVQTLVTRIRSGQIDLQPDFQRGVVWPIAKAQRLIDSILRDWHVPPIHMVRDEDGLQVVLDGQQRLTAIRDFCDDKFPVDGCVEPANKDLRALDGVFYSELPDFWRSRVDSFSIRTFSIVNYDPKEPYELFYRLNQPTVLTASEVRNAFFGPARKQIKQIVDDAEEQGMTKDTIGFSNSRMAYDDTVAKLCYTLELGTLRQKVTSAAVTQRYRARRPFPSEVVDRARRAIALLLEANLHGDSVRFNRATCLSWLYFLAARDSVFRSRSGPTNARSLHLFLHSFETTRGAAKLGAREEAASLWRHRVPDRAAYLLLHLYTDRAASRVSDVSSVLIRDVVLWSAAYAFLGGIKTRRFWLLDEFFDRLQSPKDYELAVQDFVDHSPWGEDL